VKGFGTQGGIQYPIASAGTQNVREGGEITKRIYPPINAAKTLSERLDFPATASNTPILSCLALPVKIWKFSI